MCHVEGEINDEEKRMTDTSSKNDLESWFYEWRGIKFDHATPNPLTDLH